MASIAQLLAAKKKAQPAPVDTETKEAIDRIDPPGKHQAIVITKQPAKQIAPVQAEPEERSLGRTEGEGIDYTPVGSTPEVTAWHQALNAFETELVLMTDPIDPERGWIAVRAKGMENNPILLKSFPLYQHPRTKQDPF